jgi:hypothetical protein
MRSVQIDFQNCQTTVDINNLMRCIEKCCNLPFKLGFVTLKMYDPLCQSVIITLPSIARDITNRNMLARFNAAIIGWAWGRGMPNIKIEYSMEAQKETTECNMKCLSNKDCDIPESEAPCVEPNEDPSKENPKKVTRQ